MLRENYHGESNDKRCYQHRYFGVGEVRGARLRQHQIDH